MLRPPPQPPPARPTARGRIPQSIASALGVPLSNFVLVVLTLVAALPSASNVVMLAERFDADSGRIARIIMISTAVAFLTFSAAVAILT